MATVSRNYSCATSSNQMAQIFKSNQIISRTLMLVVTFATTYFAFRFLPPPINQWIGCSIFFIGVIHVIFGRFSKAVEVVKVYWPFPSTPVYYPRRRCYTYTPPSTYYKSYKPTSQFHSLPKKEPQVGTFHPQARSSGTRPVQKTDHYMPTQTRTVPLPSNPSPCIPTRPLPKKEPSVPVYTSNQQLGSLHTQTRSSGTRPVQKTDHYIPIQTRGVPLPSNPSPCIPTRPLPKKEPSVPVYTSNQQLSSLHTQTRLSGTRPVQKTDHYIPEKTREVFPLSNPYSLPATQSSFQKEPSIDINDDHKRAQLHLRATNSGKRPCKK